MSNSHKAEKSHNVGTPRNRVSLEKVNCSAGTVEVACVLVRLKPPYRIRNSPSLVSDWLRRIQFTPSPLALV